MNSIQGREAPAEVLHGTLVDGRKRGEHQPLRSHCWLCHCIANVDRRPFLLTAYRSILPVGNLYYQLVILKQPLLCLQPSRPLQRALRCQSATHQPRPRQSVLWPTQACCKQHSQRLQCLTARRPVGCSHNFLPCSTPSSVASSSCEWAHTTHRQDLCDHEGLAANEQSESHNLS